MSRTFRLTDVDFADPLHRRAMRALTATGHYEETPDSFEWQALEAADLAYIVSEGFRDLPGEVYALLENTGLHDTTQAHESECLWRDARAIAEALAEEVTDE